MVENISVVIIVKNGADTIGKCLEALIDFKDVVVYDNGSTDGTQDICCCYSNVNLVEGDFLGFGATKNHAITFAKYEWILSLDSDEVLEEKLVDEIKSLSLERDTVYAIKRDNYYGNRLIRCCGWDNDYVLRLFNKNDVLFKNKLVHESLKIDNKKIKKLHYTIKHYPYKSIDELIYKMQNYSALYAKEHHGKKSTAWKAYSRASFSFIKNYFFQRGCLYGYEGLLISITNANNVFYKYMKLAENNKD